MSEEITKPVKKPVARKAATKTAEAHAVAPRKRVVKHVEEPVVEQTEVLSEQTVQAKPQTGAPQQGRYLFSTGRRKTAVANIRMFTGKGESVVNKKPINEYFSHQFLRDDALFAFKVTGMGNQYYFTATVNGGGIKAQAGAVRHGLAQSLATLSDEVKRVLKKNGLLTRDDRKKERKKPGLKRARRAPQWAKR